MKNIDFIIPVHSKDFSTLELTINSIKNLSSCRNIYIISNKNANIENTIFISEHLYANYVTIEMIEERYSKKNSKYISRSSWLYQQFLKLLATKIIPNLSDTFVIVDSDTIFLKDITFKPEIFYYCKAKEYHIPYLRPIKTLLNLQSTISFSTICHHSIFLKSTLDQMISDIEIRFNTNFVDAVLNTLDLNEVSNFSEWDLYSNYMILNHLDQTKARSLKYKDIKFIPKLVHLMLYSFYFDFISSHAYQRSDK